MKTQAEKSWRALSSKLKQWINERPWSRRAADAGHHDTDSSPTDAPPGVYVATADPSDEQFGLTAPGAFSVQAESYGDSGSPGGVYGVIYDPKNSPDSLEWAESLAMQDQQAADSPANMITDVGSYLSVPDELGGADAEPGGWGHIVQQGSTEGGFELPSPPQDAPADRSEILTEAAEGRLNMSDVFNDRKSI